MTMVSEFEILKAACGADSNGIGKAIIQIETKCMDFANNQQKIFEEYTILDAVLNVSRNMRRTIVDVIFEDAANYDLVQLFEMLNRFTDITHSVTDESAETPVIQMTIIPKEFAGKYFCSGFHASWVLTATQLNRLPNSIRFFFDNDTFNTYRMTDTVDDTEEQEGAW